jgi:hypothetical protein
MAEYKTREEVMEPVVEKITEEIEVIGNTDSLTLKKDKKIVL